MVEKKKDKKEGSASATPFETVTLAEIFIQQGYLGKGLEIYRKLSHSEPTNPDYQKKITELTDRIREEGSVAEIIKHASGPGPPSAAENAIEKNRIVSEDQHRVLETLNKWLIAVRKRKKHVQ